MIAVSKLVYRLVVVASPALRLATVVSPRSALPNTFKLPVVVALPNTSTVKLRFSAHEAPSQYSVEFVAVPS